jgi:hypothetical protein
MSESNYKPDGTGVVMGDTKAMPDRGSSTGMTGFELQDEGMSLDPEATNTIGKITGATRSDAPGECYADDPAFGAAKGDAAEDAAEDKASY